MSIHSATAKVPTKSASRYLQQLCKHWSHNLAVTFTAEEGTITFPPDMRGKGFPAEAKVILQARQASLDVLVDASASDQLEG